MPDKKSGMNFLERTGLVRAYRNPEARIEPRAHLVHVLPLLPPLPLPGLLYHLDGDYTPPDRHATQPWPHNETSENA